VIDDMQGVSSGRVMFGFYVFKSFADPSVDVAFGQVLVHIGQVVDVDVRCGAVRHYGNPGSVVPDCEMMQNVLQRHTVINRGVFQGPSAWAPLEVKKICTNI